MAAKIDLKDRKEILLIVPMHYVGFYYLIWNYFVVLLYWKFSINLVLNGYYDVVIGSQKIWKDWKGNGIFIPNH